MERLAVFVFGLAAGSAVNVVVSRFGDLGSFLTGRSVCDHCHKPLGVFELIPVVSFVIQQGRCRRCGKPISWRYPVVELLCGVVAVSLYQGPNLQFLVTLLFFLTLLIASLIDLDTLTIPNELLLVAVALALTKQALVGINLESASQTLIGAAVGAFVPAAVVVPSRAKAMGVGDIKLGAVMGLWLGISSVLVAFWFGFVAGGVVAAGLLLAKKKKLADQVAFGPFLALGTLLAHLYGSKVLAYVAF